MQRPFHIIFGFITVRTSLVLKFLSEMQTTWRHIETKDNELFDLFFNPEVPKAFYQTSDFDKVLADVWDLMIKEVAAEEDKTK